MSIELSGNASNEALVTSETASDETLSTTVTPGIYETRMMSYYPQVISAITEFKAIINAECYEFESYNLGRNKVINEAYLITMDEYRIEQWEKVLGITPIDNSSIEDRRDTVIARIRGQGKLNTELINSIVNAFTGGTANSWVKNSTLYVEITPPPGNKQYQFSNVEQELKKKVPAHLGFQVKRNYYEWGEVKTTFATWQDVKDEGNWETIYLYVPFSSDT